ncbi:SEC-C metal-binding domain-containing protein [Clostridium sp. OS1-26]|uniref:SEC-C metal-binding domain-containing protein n=1 Tax=Clostridium sp. OS1-26 TaxID=3070681 RepID=UPI0027E1B23B|nr:SEC-C metal-binding domain-containing protein [Clostridium sp. OS1-26]WML36358.1 SEC-C metal-binding domain-containing protein [Clostridium sp. OS1-26]
MSLYKNWTDMVIDFVKTRGEAEFWKEYGSIEKHIYTRILAEHKDTVSGSIKDLASRYETTTIFFMGFLDGINDSLEEALDLESLEEDSDISVKINFEKLYFNMLDAKADYLYGLPQWESIFSPEKRKEIRQQWAASKTVVNKNKVGRNDSCPCGSGKKYKNCCGK